VNALSFPNIAAVLISTAAVLTSACGGSSTSPTAARDYSGSWAGTTSQGNPITFQVSGNSVSNLNMGVSYSGHFSNSLGSGTCTASFTLTLGFNGNALNPPMPINADSFRSAVSGSTDVVVGTFNSATSASGNATFLSGLQGANTGGCVSTAATAITWTATKR